MGKRVQFWVKMPGRPRWEWPGRPRQAVPNAIPDAQLRWSEMVGSALMERGGDPLRCEYLLAGMYLAWNDVLSTYWGQAGALGEFIRTRLKIVLRPSFWESLEAARGIRRRHLLGKFAVLSDELVTIYAEAVRRRRQTPPQAVLDDTYQIWELSNEDILLALVTRDHPSWGKDLIQTGLDLAALERKVMSAR